MTQIKLVTPPINEVAITAAFLWEGLIYPRNGEVEAVDAQGQSLSQCIAERHGGFIGLASDISDVAVAIATIKVSLYAVNEMEFPGVFDYAISDEVGHSMRKFAAQNEGDIPNEAAITNEIIRQVREFFTDYDLPVRDLVERAMKATVETSFDNPRKDEPDNEPSPNDFTDTYGKHLKAGMIIDYADFGLCRIQNIDATRAMVLVSGEGPFDLKGTFTIAPGAIYRVLDQATS
jgi:hypothetical protein